MCLVVGGSGSDVPFVVVGPYGARRTAHARRDRHETVSLREPWAHDGATARLKLLKKTHCTMDLKRTIQMSSRQQTTGEGHWHRIPQSGRTRGLLQRAGVRERTGRNRIGAVHELHLDPAGPGALTTFRKSRAKPMKSRWTSKPSATSACSKRREKATTSKPKTPSTASYQAA